MWTLLSLFQFHLLNKVKDRTKCNWTNVNHYNALFDTPMIYFDDIYFVYVLSLVWHRITFIYYITKNIQIRYFLLTFFLCYLGNFYKSEGRCKHINMRDNLLQRNIVHEMHHGWPKFERVSNILKQNPIFYVIVRSKQYMYLCILLWNSNMLTWFVS